MATDSASAIDPTSRTTADEAHVTPTVDFLLLLGLMSVIALACVAIIL